MKKKTKHHRCPRSLKGNDRPDNISYVCRKKHEAWHVLFGNMHALQILCELNNKYLKEFIFIIQPKGNPRDIILGGNESNHLIKKRRAWDTLFPTVDEIEICNEINDRWIDPNYFFLPVRVRGRVLLNSRTPAYSQEPRFVSLP